jgi:hypothetical protein
MEPMTACLSWTFTAVSDGVTTPGRSGSDA